MIERIVVIGIGFVMDFFFGDPHWLWHPVQGIGKLIEGIKTLFFRWFSLEGKREEKYVKKRILGGILVLLVLGITIGIVCLLLFLCNQIHPLLRLGVEGILCYQMLAMKSLKTESMKVYQELKKQDLFKARKAVAMIVGRDTEQLSEEGVTKATVETIAENTSDGVIAPLFYMLFFGILGGVFYKAVNTMDSMIGYKNDQYYYFGTAAAKLDDIMNFLPARISALVMIFVAGLMGMNQKNAWKIFCRDRFQHPSPNSAQTEAVCAGALDIELAGDAWYFGKLHHKKTIGDANRKIEIEDIKRANRLMYGTSFFVWIVGMLLLIGSIYL